MSRRAPLRLTVVVDQVEPARWIVVVDAHDGPFSTETDSARRVEDAARAAIGEVLRTAEVELTFVDTGGGPWSPPARD